MKKYLTYPFLIRIGLACAFFANTLTAFFTPGEFEDIVSGSFLVHILPISVASFVVLISINDLIVSVLLLFGWRTARVAVWAAIWIVGVIIVNGIFSFDALEHLAFLAMAVALAVRGSNKC